MSLLTVDQVVKRFGGLVAVDGMSLEVDRGQVTALIGPNGAGKTTLFNCITGLLEADTGEVRLDGRSLAGLDVYQRARAGLGRTFQRLEPFVGMTVAENLQVAAEVAIPGSVLTGLFRLRHPVDARVDALVEEVLEQTGLSSIATDVAGGLSTGTLRLVELARALCTRPKVLLLDEPASGLDTIESDRLEELLRSIADSGVGILLVEHDVELVLRVADHVHVMDFGRPVTDGPPEAIAHDPAVQAVYLGVADPTVAP